MQRSTLEAWLLVLVSSTWWVAFFLPVPWLTLRLVLFMVPCGLLIHFPWSSGETGR